MIHFPAERLSILQVWAKGVELWKKSFVKMLPLMLLLILWVYVPSFLFRSNVVLSSPIWIFLSIMFIYIIGSFFFSGAIYYRMHLLILHRKISNLRALKIAAKRLGKLTLAIIIAVLVVTAGFLLFFPGVYFLVFVWFYFPIIIFNNLDPIRALKTSYKLVHKHWWQTAVIVYVPLLLLISIGSVIEYYTVGVSLTHLVSVNAATKGWYLQTIAKIILTFIFFPFFIAIIVIQLENLRREFSEEFVANLADFPVLPGGEFLTVSETK